MESKWDSLQMEGPRTTLTSPAFNRLPLLESPLAPVPPQTSLHSSTKFQPSYQSGLETSTTILSSYSLTAKSQMSNPLCK